MSKSEENQNNVSEWSDMSTRGPFFQIAITMKIRPRRVGLVQRDVNSSYLTNSCEIVHLALKSNHSLTMNFNIMFSTITKFVL